MDDEPKPKGDRPEWVSSAITAGLGVMAVVLVGFVILLFRFMSMTGWWAF